jgi:hypothetical protein
MQDKNKVEENVKKWKTSPVRLILFIIFVLLLSYVYYLFVQQGVNPFIIIILLVFVFLITIGPFFRKKNRRSLYSRMFPDRKKRPPPQKKKKKRRPIMEKKPIQLQPKIFKSIDLEFEYRKPLLSKCENCGNILPSFVKNKCPFCGEQL